ncbi:S-adenosyl-L-methionine-dependent methyltransferase [Haematococcus lacustris]
MAPAADGAQDGAQTQYAPNPRIQYAEPAYWDQRYKAQPLSFDWFYGWQALRKLIRTHLPRRKAVIQIGCGNSNLQEGMARNGYHVVNVDISQVVIDQMREQHASIPNCTYVLGDCRDLSMFGNCHFYGAIEKGTIDALVCSPDSAVNIHRMCMELLRVLQPGATFMAISLGEPSQRLPLLCRPEYGWTVSLCLIPRVGADAMVPAPGRCDMGLT